MKGMSLFFTITIASAGLLATPFVLFRIWRQFWLEAEGVITSVKVRQKRNAEKKRIRVVDVQYEYLVSGQRFRGADAIEIDVPYYQEDEVIAELTANYKPGDSIAVYHPASAPQVNALKRAIGLDKIMYAIGFLALVVMGSYVYFAGATDSINKKPNHAAEPTRVSAPH